MNILHHYALWGYTEINQYLRGLKPTRELPCGKIINPPIKEVEDKIYSMEHEYDKLPYLSSTPVLYRGLNKKVVNSLKIGSVYSDKAYMSVSPDLEVAKTFSKAKQLFKIFLYNNSKNVKDITAYNFLNETEYLIKPNTKFVVTNICKDFIELHEVK